MVFSPIGLFIDKRISSGNSVKAWQSTMAGLFSAIVIKKERSLPAYAYFVIYEGILCPQDDHLFAHYQYPSYC